MPTPPADHGPFAPPPVPDYALPPPQPQQDRPLAAPTPWLKRVTAPIAAVSFALVKWGAIIFKLKVFTTAASMLVSIAAYAWIWVLPFAIGFVVLIFVHELGHVIELRRQGVPASAPLFIPFLGAVIGMKQLPDDAWAEAKRAGIAYAPMVQTLLPTLMRLDAAGKWEPDMPARAAVGGLHELSAAAISAKAYSEVKKELSIGIALTLLQPSDRDAGPPRHNGGNLICGHHLTQQPMLSLLAGQPRLGGLKFPQ